jgi:hypothetical protein
MTKTLEGDSARNTAPGDTLVHDLARASAARARVLDGATNDHLVGVLAGAARLWSRRDFQPRARTIERLAARLAMHPEMVAHGLDDLFGSITEDSLAELLGEAQDPAALERAVTGPLARRRRLLGAPVVLYALAGNVPGLAIAPLVASVLARSIAIIRDSARQPWLTRAFLDTVAEHDPDVAALIVPEFWDAADHARERRVFELAARVELYGSDPTLADIRARHPHAGTRIVERGTRLSAGLVTATADTACAAAFAEDLVLYDGLGCLSPHAIVVEGGRRRAAALAERMAAALEELERRWPRQPRGFALETRRRGFIDAAEARSLGSDRDELLRGAGDAWVVHVTEAVRLELGPGLRCVRVVACEDRAAALALLGTAPTPLAAVGLALDGAATERHAVENELRGLGATHVCAPGRMQAPPITWRQDGRRRLGDLLAWQEG